MATDPFDDPFDDGEKFTNRESHTVRLSALVTAAEQRHRRSFLPWITRAIIALAVVSALIWYAIPAPMDRLYPDRIPVRVWHQWTGERKPIIDGIVKSFNESQKTYEVIALSVPSNVTDKKFMLSISGGSPPDVVTQWSPTVSTWAADGLLQPLDPFLTDDEWRILREDAYPVVLTAGSHNGTLYGITFGLNTFGLFYQPERLRAVGYTKDSFPETLEELVELSRRLDRVDENGDLLRIGFLPNRIILMAALFGGGFKVLDDGSISIYTEENVRALEYIAETYAYYGFDRVVSFRSSLNRGGLAMEWPFVSGQYPIALDGQWRVDQLARYAPDINYKTALVPAPKGGISGAGYVSANLAFIPIGAKQPAGAMEFIRFWSGLQRPERAAEFLTMGGWLPMRRAIVASPVYQEFIAQNPQFKVFLGQLSNPNLLTLPAVPYQVYFHNQLDVAEDRAVRGTVSARQALQDLDKLVRHERARRARIEAMRAKQ